jgi:hypothetical protein
VLRFSLCERKTGCPLGEQLKVVGLSLADAVSFFVGRFFAPQGRKNDPQDRESTMLPQARKALETITGYVL